MTKLESRTEVRLIRDQLDLINEGKIDLDNVSSNFVGAIKNEQNDRIKHHY